MGSSPYVTIHGQLSRLTHFLENLIFDHELRCQASLKIALDSRAQTARSTNRAASHQRIKIRNPDIGVRLNEERELNKFLEHLKNLSFCGTR